MLGICHQFFPTDHFLVAWLLVVKYIELNLKVLKIPLFNQDGFIQFSVVDNGSGIPKDSIKIAYSKNSIS